MPRRHPFPGSRPGLAETAFQAASADQVCRSLIHKIQEEPPANLRFQNGQEKTDMDIAFKLGLLIARQGPVIGFRGKLVDSVSTSACEKRDRNNTVPGPA